MKGLVDFFEPFVGDMGIDLGGGDRGVTEHGLDGADIGAIHEEVSSKGVVRDKAVSNKILSPSHCKVIDGKVASEGIE